MKRIMLCLVILCAFSGIALAGDVNVNGYWRDSNHDGVKDTYVSPYTRTAPDDSRLNNYSTQGNTNPYTGRQGTESPYSNPSTPLGGSNYGSGSNGKSLLGQ